MTNTSPAFETAAPWCSDATQTNSYIANVGKACTHATTGYLKEAGTVFRTATDFYVATDGQATTEGLPLTRAAGWLGFAGRIVSGYTKAHFDLVNSDGDYRTRLGELYDLHDFVKYGTSPKQQTEKSRQRRYAQQGHHMVKEAITEGVYTMMAAYQVTPRVAAAHSTDPDRAEAVDLSMRALPSTRSLAQNLARHSKLGDYTFIKSVMRPTLRNTKKIDYKHLTFDARRFTLTDIEATPTLRALPDSHFSGDLHRNFTGCPALYGGSITLLNKLITGIITDEHCYDRSIKDSA